MSIRLTYAFPAVLCLLRACQGAFLVNSTDASAPQTKSSHHVSQKEEADDLKALDMADDVVEQRLPPKTITLAPPKKKEAPTPRKKVHHQRQASKPQAMPSADSKESTLWSHEKELQFSNEAEAVLDKGDAAAHAKIQARRDREERLIAPAKVVHITDAEATAARTAKDDALEGSRNIEQDLKDLKEREVEEHDHEEEVTKEEQEEEEEKQSIKVEQKPTAAPQKKAADLDKLMKLSTAMKSAAGPVDSKLALVEEAPKTPEAAAAALQSKDRRATQFKKLAQSIKAAQSAGATEDAPAPLQVVQPPPQGVEPGKLQRLKSLSGKMQEAAAGQPGTGAKVVAADSQPDAAVPVANSQPVTSESPGSQAAKAQVAAAPKIAIKAFKGASTQGEVKQAAKEFHSKVADHIVGMHTALRDHAKEMEEKVHQEKVRAEQEAAQKAAEEAHRAEVLAAAKAEAEKAAEEAKKKEKDDAEKVKEQAKEQAKEEDEQREKAVAENKARALAHQKMLDYREQQKKDREAKKLEQQKHEEEAQKAQQAAQALKELEAEYPSKKLKSAAAPNAIAAAAAAAVLALLTAA